MNSLEVAKTLVSQCVLEAYKLTRRDERLFRLDTSGLIDLIWFIDISAISSLQL